jgi:hydrogenase maturation factor
VTPGDSCSDAHCITCGDEGIPMRVTVCAGATAVCVDEHDAEHEVMVELVAPANAGDQLLVHAGVAIARLGGGG